MDKRWFQIALGTVLVFGIAAIAFVVLALRFLSESGSTRFVLVNDTMDAVTYSVLHDDGDDSRNKTLRKRALLEPQDQSEIKIYGSIHCLVFYENNAPVRSVALTPEEGNSQLMTSSTSTAPRYSLSKFKQPCPFTADFPFDN